MELAVENSLPFLGIKITKIGCSLQTEVYRKPTDKGLVSHFQSHQKALLNTMLYRGLWISSTWEIFHKEVERLKEIFKKLQSYIKLFSTRLCKELYKNNNSSNSNSNKQSYSSQMMTKSLDSLFHSKTSFPVRMSKDNYCTAIK